MNVADVDKAPWMQSLFTDVSPADIAAGKHPPVI
jgi:hypothetical protein